MEKEIMKEILQECHLFDIIIAKIVKKLLLKAYHIGRINCFNSMQK